MQKKIRLAQKLAIIKKSQILSDPADIQAILPAHQLVILIKFHKDWQETVDFLVIKKFWANQIFFASVSTLQMFWMQKLQLKVVLRFQLH